MYLSQQIVEQAIEGIKNVHPFFGIDFLVAKIAGLPVGKTKLVSLDSVTRTFMDQYYKPFENSKRYYRYFHPPRNDKWWKPKYPGSTSQTRRTRGRWSVPFIHDTDNPQLWGWQNNYLEVIEHELQRILKGRRIPAFYIAAWLYRNEDWPDDTTPTDLVNAFLGEFKIKPEEATILFDLSIPTAVDKIPLLQTNPVTVNDLIPIIGIPSDLPGEGGGILSYLELQGVGPAANLNFEPGKRINLITGDNGLGKTFLLDTVWWALTGHWLGYPADPTNSPSKQATISYRVAGEYKESDTITIEYDRATFSWPTPSDSKADPCLLVYARADNSFAIWDPAQHSAKILNQRPSLLPYYNFSADEVWFGLEDKNQSLCEGLIRDWVHWQNTNDEEIASRDRQAMLTVATTDAQAMVEAAQKAGVQLMYGENWVYAPAIRKAERLITTSQGAIVEMRGGECHSGSHSPYSKIWRYTGGGALLRLGAHPIGAMLYLKQQEGLARNGRAIRPAAVSAEVGDLSQISTVAAVEKPWIATGWQDVENWAAVILTFEDGARGIVYASDAVLGGMESRLEIFSSNSHLKCNLSPNNLLQAYAPDQDVFGNEYLMEKVETKAGWSSPIPDEDWSSGHLAMCQDFVSAVAENRPALADGNLGLAATRVVYAAYQAAASGLRVDLA